MSDTEREKFEFYESQSNSHSIESKVMLTEQETGRVVAVFYNDYDCRNVTELQAENEALKAENEKLTRNLFEKDFEVAVLETNYEELQEFKEKLKDEVENLKGLLDHRDEITRS